VAHEPTLLVEEGGALRRIKLASLPADLGRDEGCAVPLGDPASSRRHARLEETPQGIAVVDLDSSNGTYLDGVRVKRALLRRGAEISIGAAKITYLGDGAPEPRRAPPPVAELAPAQVAVAVPAPAAKPAPQKRPRPVDADGRPTDPEADAEARAAPPPPPSKKTVLAGNVVTVFLLVGLNAAAYFAFTSYLGSKEEARRETGNPFDRIHDRPATRPTPVDPEAEVKAAWARASTEAAELAAEDRYEGAGNVLREFVKAHGASRFAETALDRISAIQKERDEKVANCLSNVERFARAGDVATAKKSLEVGRKLLGSLRTPALAAAEAEVEAAEKAAKEPKAPGGGR
jgi:pSer/pThr/pTyr-binding forkhead associated (FHA) protein